MSTQACRCNMQPCGCCEGVQQLTPASEDNRPGLPALVYRAGTHARFFETMKARLSTMNVDGVAADGQTPQTFRPLQGLTTRDPSDFSIALLDGWATVGDVLTFYQERIANEGFLRTATERRSVLELSRLVGYGLRPGVAATAYLAYAIDANQTEMVTIPAGAASQSIPGPGEMPQIFETSETVVARAAWNNLQVRLTQPANITLDTALTVATIHVAGTATNLKKGDKLLLVFAEDGSQSALRTVASIDTQFADQRTAITLQAVDPLVAACVPLLSNCLAGLPNACPAPTQQEKDVLLTGKNLLADTLLGLLSHPSDWVWSICDESTLGPIYQAAFTKLGSDITAQTTANGVSGPKPTTPDDFVMPLLRGMVPQARNSLGLVRSLSGAFQHGADTSPQLLVELAPVLKDTYYQAWAGANLNVKSAPLLGIYAFRASGGLFGAGASKLPSYYNANDLSGLPAGTLKSPDQWDDDWNYQNDETSDNAFLDQANDAVISGSYVLAINPQAAYGTRQRQLLQVKDATISPRVAYGLSGKTTALVFGAGTDWRTTESCIDGCVMVRISDMRTTQVYSQSEPLTLLETPLTEPVATQEIQLDGLYKELTSGRWVILSGERADIDAVSGVMVSELQMISGLTHGFDETLAGDQIHTTLQLATPLAYQYKRNTLTIYGNVVKATHGSTCNELLGSGDGAQSLPSFTLKQPPLTFVAAPTAAGAESTLHVYVNNVEWHETESLAWLGPKDRGFVTFTDDDGNTTLTFGDGSNGARLPSGVQNVTSVYRTGIGAVGNVKAGQISMLQTRPLGVKSVVNPLRASGGADKESRDLARENAPLSVMPLDRLVSTQDYADFTRSFAGIAKALARRISDGQREIVYLTIAGTGDAPIDTSSDLYRNLLEALHQLGDPDLPIRVDVRELSVLVLSAKIKLMADFLWESVASAVRAKLLDSFGFDRRALGQWVLTSEVISVIQNVAGVAYVDVDALGVIPEKTQPARGEAGLLTTQKQIFDYVQNIVNPKSAGAGHKHGDRYNRRVFLAERVPPSISARAGGSDGGVLRPAELVIFMPTVADTLILNQTL